MQTFSPMSLTVIFFEFFSDYFAIIVRFLTSEWSDASCFAHWL